MIQIIPPHHGGDALRAALAHLAALDVNDRAESAGKRAAPGSIGSGKTRIGEVFHRFRTGLRQRRVLDVDEILQVLGKAIKRLQSTV